MLISLCVSTQTRAQTATATFVTTDIATQGNWQGKYGADGNSIEAVTPSLPSYVTLFNPTGNNTYTWAASTNDVRALENGGSRIASTWYSDSTYYDDLTLTSSHQVCVYALDWDTFDGGRSETLQITDATAGTILASQSISAFTSGVYACFNISGHVHINFLNNLSTSNVTSSGIFFDPVATSSGGAPALVFAMQSSGLNTTLQSGTFNGTYTVSVSINSGGTAPAHQVTLTWVPSTNSGVTGYNVYRSQTNGSGYVKLTGTPVSGLTYVDANVTGGQTYYYEVTVVSGAAESAPSNQVTMLVPAP